MSSIGENSGESLKGNSLGSIESTDKISDAYMYFEGDPSGVNNSTDEWPEVYERIKASAEAYEQAMYDHTPTPEEVAVLGLAGAVKDRMLKVWNDAFLKERGNFFVRRRIKHEYGDSMPNVFVEYSKDERLFFIPPDLLLVTPWTPSTQDPQVEYRATITDDLDFDIAWTSSKHDDPALQQLGLFERQPFTIEERQLGDGVIHHVGTIDTYRSVIYSRDTDPTSHWPTHEQAVKLRGILGDILAVLS